MSAEGWIVRFNERKTENEARASVGKALANQGELASIANHAEALDANCTVWSFPATPTTSILSDSQAWDLAYRIRQSQDVVIAEPLVQVPGMPIEVPSAAPLNFGSMFRDEHIPESEPVDWALTKLRVRAAWANLVQAFPNQTPGQGVVIGHPDTGYTLHPELLSGTNIDSVRGLNFKDRGVLLPIDPLTGVAGGHGTATASVFLSAGATQINPGVLGVAPGATLVPIRIHDSVIHFHWGNLCKALYHAADSGCHVVSMSLGGAWGGDSLHDAVRYAASKGVILIAAAGNHTPFVVYPAKYPETLALAASNALDGLWSGSALGNQVDVTAPGESVWRGCADLNGLGQPRYSVARSSGTSYSTALTAGVCALWLQRHGYQALLARYGAGLGTAFRQLIQNTARRVPGWPTQKAGSGIVDASALISAPLPALGPLSLSGPTVHPRIAEIATLRKQSVPETTSWLVTKLRTTPGALAARLDDVGAELSLIMLHKAFAERTAAPQPMSATAPVVKSMHLQSIAPDL